jgi:hypothetical protein
MTRQQGLISIGIDREMFNAILLEVAESLPDSRKKYRRLLKTYYTVKYVDREMDRVKYFLW